jgi:trimeric autotransporter adhesin
MVFMIPSIHHKNIHKTGRKSFMAYQPKSYRKFVATTATAAMVASAVAPVVSAAAGFTDVASQYKDAVDFLVSAGVKGKSETKFGVYDEITRLDAAVILAKVLKLDVDNAKDAGFTDVPKDRAKYVNALVDAGVLNGKAAGKFGAYDKLTRAEMAKIIANAYKLKGDDVTLPFTDVNDTWAPYVKALYKNGITKGKSETKFGANDNITRGDFAVFVYRAANVDVAPQVVSVSAINAKQVVVKFNKAVQAGTATGGAQVVANYSLDGTNPTRVELSEDKKTATLTFGAGFVSKLNKYVEFKVENIKDATGKDVAKYQAPLFLEDKQAPTATVEYKAPNVVVSFSEPLKKQGTELGSVSTNTATVSVDGVPTTSYTITDDNTAGDTLTGASKITLSGLTPGEHTITIVGAQDLAGNFLPDVTLKVNVSEDKTAPQVVSMTAEGSKIRVKFSEPVVDATINGQTNKRLWLTDGTTDVYATSAEQVDTEGKEYLVDASAFIPAGNNFVTKEITVKAGSKDASGNTSSDFKQTLTITKDETAPKVVSTSYKDDKIIVKFDEPIVAGASPLTTGTDLNVRYTDTDGVVKVDNAATYSAVAYVYDANNDGDTTDAGENQYLVIPVTDTDFVASSKLKAGSYEVTLPTGVVKDVYNNSTTAPIKLTFTVAQDSNTSATLGLAVTQVSPGVLDFTIGVPGTELTSAALDVNKFTINGAALPAGTKLYFFGDKHTIRAELPEGAITANGIRTVAARDITDKYGNTLTQAAKDGIAVNLTENVRPTAQKVELVDNKTLYVTFSEKLGTLPGTVTGIKVKKNGSYVDATDLAFAVVNNNQLKITTTNTVFNLSDSITVEITGTNVADTNGNLVKDAVISK